MAGKLSGTAVLILSSQAYVIHMPETFFYSPDGRRKAQGKKSRSLKSLPRDSVIRS